MSPEKFNDIIKKLLPIWNKKHIKKKKLDGRPYGIGSLENQFLLFSLCIFQSFLLSCDKNKNLGILKNQVKPISNNTIQDESLTTSNQNVLTDKDMGKEEKEVSFISTNKEIKIIRNPLIVILGISKYNVSKYEDLKGVKPDCNGFIKLFESYKYKVIYNDFEKIDKNGIKNFCKNCNKKFLSTNKYDSIIFIYSGHGLIGKIVDSNGVTIDISSIINLSFKKITKNFPKIFMKFGCRSGDAVGSDKITDPYQSIVNINTKIYHNTIPNLLCIYFNSPYYTTKDKLKKYIEGVSPSGSQFIKLLEHNYKYPSKLLTLFDIFYKKNLKDFNEALFYHSTFCNFSDLILIKKISNSKNNYDNNIFEINSIKNDGRKKYLGINFLRSKKYDTKDDLEMIKSLLQNLNPENNLQTNILNISNELLKNQVLVESQSSLMIPTELFTFSNKTNNNKDNSSFNIQNPNVYILRSIPEIYQKYEKNIIFNMNLIEEYFKTNYENYINIENSIVNNSEDFLDLFDGGLKEDSSEEEEDENEDKSFSNQKSNIDVDGNILFLFGFGDPDHIIFDEYEEGSYINIKKPNSLNIPHLMFGKNTISIYQSSRDDKELPFFLFNVIIDENLL
ncbi:MAG: caspase family protein [Bacteroidetes bacterium]|nr:caspase family protein [Bacteroidota bacterium]